VRPLGVIGNITRDVVDGRPPRLGGGPFYAARALRLMSFPARIATKCAPADRGLVRTLAALGVPVSWHPAGSTAAFTFSYEGDRRAMTVDELGEPWAPLEALEAAGKATWVHVSPVVRSDFPAETVAALARAHRVSFDGQGLVRPARAGPLVLDADFDPALLRSIRVLKLAEDEAEAIGDLERLGVPELVVTLGARGSLVWLAGRSTHVPAYPARQRVDSTGAGDAFGVAYVAGRASGYPPVAAARRASLVAAAMLR
jgi:sugar/nucleoside kinase (ribokinase family)